MLTSTDELLSTGQAARRAGVSREAVAQWIRLGRLNAVSTPLGKLVRPDDLDRVVTQRKERRSTSAHAS